MKNHKLICKIECNKNDKNCFGIFCFFPIIIRSPSTQNESPFNDLDVKYYGLLCPNSFINETMIRENNISLKLTFKITKKKIKLFVKWFNIYLYFKFSKYRYK